MQSFEQMRNDGQERRVLNGGELTHVKDSGEQIANTIIAMYRDGASREDILAAVREKTEQVLESIDHQMKH